MLLSPGSWRAPCLLCCDGAALCWQIWHHAGLLARWAQREADVPCPGADPGRPAARQRPARKFTAGVMFFFWVSKEFSGLDLTFNKFPFRMGRTTSLWTTHRAPRMTVSHRPHLGLRLKRSWDWPATLCPPGSNIHPVLLKGPESQSSY